MCKALWKNIPLYRYRNIAINVFSDNVMSCFRKILQRRQNQQILDMFLVKAMRKDNQ